MDKLDEQILAALENASLQPEPDDELAGLTQDFLETFQGTYRHVMMITWLKMGIVYVLMLGSAYQFFQQDAVMPMIAWASATIIFTVAATCIMLFLWIKINHNTTTREIKKLELQIALMVREIRATAATQEN